MEFKDNDPLMDLLRASSNYLRNPTDENKQHFNRLFDFTRSFASLPDPTYTRMVGFGDQVQRLQKQLSDAADQKIISIQGFSGFGKTALADNVVRHISPENFENLPNVRWMTVKPRGSITASRSMGAASNIIDAQFYLEMGRQLGIQDVASVASLQVEQILENTAVNPAIFVIDNLQNPADVESLRKLMLPLLGQVRVLYTSPQSSSTSDASEVQHVIEPLDGSATIELMHVEGNDFLRQLPDNELYDVYQVLGGYPLAVKLTAKQIEKKQSLDQVMKNIAVPENASPEDVSDQVHEVVWANLNDVEQDVLETIAMYGVGGAHLSTLQMVLKELPEQSLAAVLTHLQEISAIYDDHDQNGIRYYTHEMTTVYVDKL